MSVSVSVCVPGPLVLDVRDPTPASLHPVPVPPNGRVLNVPMDDLRHRMGEVQAAVAARGAHAPPPVTVCTLGKTSYFAGRVLAHHGIDTVSLMGGASALRGQALEVRCVWWGGGGGGGAGRSWGHVSCWCKCLCFCCVGVSVLCECGRGRMRCANFGCMGHQAHAPLNWRLTQPPLVRAVCPSAPSAPSIRC